GGRDLLIDAESLSAHAIVHVVSTPASRRQVSGIKARERRPLRRGGRSWKLKTKRPVKTLYGSDDSMNVDERQCLKRRRLTRDGECLTVRTLASPSGLILSMLRNICKTEI